MAYIGQEIKGGTFKVLDTSGNTYNGSNTTFSLGTQVGAAAQLLVSHDGVIQKPGTDYTLASGGASITFSTAPASGASIFIVEISGAVGGTITPADNSVGVTQLNLSDGSNGQVLKTDGSGTLSFTTVSGTTINNNANNRVITGSGTANTLEGESTLTYDGTQLVLTDGTEGTDNLLVKTTADGSISMALEKSDFKFDVGLDHNNDGSQNFFIRERHQGGSNTNAVRMMIDSSGNLTIGGTSSDLSGVTRKFAVQGGDEYTAGFRGQNSSKEVVVIHNQTTGSSDRYMIEFKTGGGGGSGVGSIRSNASSTAFNTSSDYRLKENEVAISDGITRLKQLKPYKFNFKVETDKTVDGFFAHEVSSIVPEAISGEKDAVKEDGTIIPQQIDQAKLVPLLTSALQEAITKIETLEARVTTLEG